MLVASNHHARSPVSASEALTRELIALVRGLRELKHATDEPGTPRLELATAAVLGTVGDAGPLRLSELADRLGLDVSTVSRQVPALERAGWVVRDPDPCDRRAQLLRLSPEGHDALAARRRAHAAVLRDVLGSWNDAQVQALADDLARLNTDLSAHRTARSSDAPVPVPLEVS
ncbi:MAG: hypothetical protein JWO60_2556 [Frankiales bacterium]|nr:hypothetical protein [Frankiales bacterium]